VKGPGEGAPVQEQVHVPPARHLGSADAGGLGQLPRQLLRELPWLAPEPLRHVEGGRQGQVAQLDTGGIVEGDALEGDVERPTRRPADSLRETLLCLEHHNVQF
jgi:hypothetical protein